MPERRYTEADARRIFAAVAERQKAVAPGDDGLTLAELQEVARASGLDPSLVAAVAAEGATPEASGEVRRVMGVPAEVRRVRVLPGPVSDAAWERIVADLRATFKTPGNPSQIGRVREWTGGDAYGSAFRVALEPLAEGTRVVVEQTQERQAKQGLVVSGVFAAIAALLGVVILVSGAEPDLWGAVLTFGLFAALAFGGTWVGLRSWASRNGVNSDALLDRIDLAARNAAPLAPEAAAPRLDLDVLPDAPEADHASGEPRTRERS